jgi:hypothetical protein
MNPFVDAAHRFFDPISRIADMACVTEKGAQVRYENESVFMDVVFDAHRSYEISVVIGELSAPKTQKGMPFDLGIILRMQAYPSDPEPCLMIGNNPSTITVGIERLAKLTKEHAVDLLKHDEGKFLEVATFLKWASLKYAWDRNIPKSVTAAYRGLIGSAGYEALKRRLTENDLAILETARKLSEGEP